MYNGDRNRKEVLVEHGFRLPSALDNRPLRFEEFEELCEQVIFVSATPGAVRAGADRRRGRRADHPPDGPGGPGDRGPPRPRAGADLLERDPQARGRAASGRWSPR